MKNVTENSPFSVYILFYATVHTCKQNNGPLVSFSEVFFLQSLFILLGLMYIIFVCLLKRAPHRLKSPHCDCLVVIFCWNLMKNVYKINMIHLFHFRVNFSPKVKYDNIFFIILVRFGVFE